MIVYSLRAVAAVAMLVVAAPAFAQTQVTDRGDLAGATTVSWSQLGGSGTLVSNPFTFETAGGTATGSTNGFTEVLVAGTGWNGGFVNGQSLLFAEGATNMTFDFGSLVRGFATQGWFNFGGGDRAVGIEAFRAGSSIGFFSVMTGGGSAPNSNQASVIGIADATGFDRIRLSGESEFAINQLTLGEFAGSPTVTPEPASMALLATGLAGLGLARRRRRALQS